jgi:predicted amidohydrolase YtcJ
MPVRDRVAEGAVVGAGSDYPVGPYYATRSLHGMVTRDVPGVGVLGADYAVDRDTAVSLYTDSAAVLLGEGDRLGTLEPGKLADLVAYRADPLTCGLNELETLNPALSIVNGHAVHDPDHLANHAEIPPSPRGHTGTRSAVNEYSCC